MDRYNLKKNAHRNRTKRPVLMRFSGGGGFGKFASHGKTGQSGRGTRFSAKYSMARWWSRRAVPAAMHEQMLGLPLSTLGTEVTGAKVIRRAVNEFMVVGVASTALKDGSAKERLRAEKVCRIKALAAIVSEKRGVQVAHVEQLKEKTVVVVATLNRSAVRMERSISFGIMETGRRGPISSRQAEVWL
jgi:hypothetical protein